MTDDERFEQQLEAFRLFCASFKSRKRLLAIRGVVDDFLGYRETVQYFYDRGILIEGVQQ